MNFNEWVLTKILGHLAHSEGFEVANAFQGKTGMKAIVTDVFGYRYGITVTTLGRTDVNPGADVARYDKETVKCAQS